MDDQEKVVDFYTEMKNITDLYIFFHCAVLFRRLFTPFQRCTNLVLCFQRDLPSIIVVKMS